MHLALAKYKQTNDVNLESFFVFVIYTNNIVFIDGVRLFKLLYGNDFTQGRRHGVRLGVAISKCLDAVTAMGAAGGGLWASTHLFTSRKKEKIVAAKLSIHSKNTRVSCDPEKGPLGPNSIRGLKDDPEIGQLSADLTNNGVRFDTFLGHIPRQED